MPPSVHEKTRKPAICGPSGVRVRTFRLRLMMKLLSHLVPAGRWAFSLLVEICRSRLRGSLLLRKIPRSYFSIPAARLAESGSMQDGLATFKLCSVGVKRPFSGSRRKAATLPLY